VLIESHQDRMTSELFYLTGIKELYDRCTGVTYVLLIRVIMLKNKVKILLMPFLPYIELHKFLNAPRTHYLPPSTHPNAP